MERLSLALFGPNGLPKPEPVPESPAVPLLRHAARLRELAERGMSPRKFIREAERAEAEAARLTALEVNS